jgi:hypothetical protein
VNILRIFAVKFMYGINPKIDKIAGRWSMILEFPVA